MGRLVVVRHGQASLMKADYDELSPRGREQATALGEHLAAQGWSFDAVFSGPARRQRDTASLTGEAVRAADQPWPELTELAALDEHDAFALIRAGVGLLAHDPEVGAANRVLLAATTPAARSGAFQRLFEALMHRWLRDELRPPGVETWPEFQTRVGAGLDAMIAAGARSIVAFSSVGPLAVILQRALGTSDADSFRTAWRIRNASLTTFVFDDAGRFTLDAFNALPHLPDPRTWTFR
ncbi:MAG: histidine phosphatase family protein [Myxococcales bacterium]|nr:histidine phosphatase family protein [Myxococcales bacterium]MCB9715342.1 histidine phosphatase family protein [Myxococcales bacterium]